MFYTGLTTDTPICSESPESFPQPISLPLSSPQQLLFFPFHSLPIKAELNLLRGPNRCVLFLQQFEMITQLWCLSVTSCDDRHCNRAGEIVFFHSRTPHLLHPILSLSPLLPPPPQQSSHSWYLPPADGKEGGVHVSLKTPHYQPPLCQEPTPSHHPCCLMDKHTFKMGKRGEHDRHVALET